MNKSILPTNPNIQVYDPSCIAALYYDSSNQTVTVRNIYDNSLYGTITSVQNCGTYCMSISGSRVAVTKYINGSDTVCIYQRNGSAYELFCTIPNSQDTQQIALDQYGNEIYLYQSGYSENTISKYSVLSTPKLQWSIGTGARSVGGSILCVSSRYQYFFLKHASNYYFTSSGTFNKCGGTYSDASSVLWSVYDSYNVVNRYSWVYYGTNNNLNSPYSLNELKLPTSGELYFIGEQLYTISSTLIAAYEFNYSTSTWVKISQINPNIEGQITKVCNNGSIFSVSNGVLYRYSVGLIQNRKINKFSAFLSIVGDIQGLGYVKEDVAAGQTGKIISVFTP